MERADLVGDVSGSDLVEIMSTDGDESTSSSEILVEFVLQRNEKLNEFGKETTDLKVDEAGVG